MPDPSAHRPETSAAEATHLHDEAQHHFDRSEYADARALFDQALALRRSATTLGALALVQWPRTGPAPP